MSRDHKASLKHGLYARRMTQDEIETIGAIPILNIDGEIAYQRALINRLGQIIESNGLAADSTGVLSAETRSTIKLFNEAMTRLLSYLRMHDMLKGDLTEYRAEIERGKMIGRQRRHVFDYFASPAAVAPLPPGVQAPVARKSASRKKRLTSRTRD